MAHAQPLGALAEAARRSLQTEEVTEGGAALARSLFPHAATLRVSLLTGDGQVLASLGSLISPGPLALALVPVRASAAGAAVVRQAPMYLTAESRGALPCYDFEGHSVFCLPLTAGRRRLGALLLSFPSPAAVPASGTATGLSSSSSEGSGSGSGGSCGDGGGGSGQVLLDGRHARNLLLLAGAMAPGVQAAAAPLLRQCNLILGVELQPASLEGAAAAAAAASEEGEGSSSEVWLTESEEEAWEDDGEGEGEEMEVEVEEGMEGPEREAPARGRQRGEQPLLPPPQLLWSAGGCRGEGGQPPEDPGSSAAAVAVGPAAGEGLEQQDSLHGGSQWWSQQQAQGQQGQRPEWPESPSALKARARAEASATAGGAGYSRASSVDSSWATASSRDSSPLQLQKVSPPGRSWPAAADTSACQLAQAGATWRCLLRFADQQLEVRFALHLHQQLWKVDVASASLFVALQLAMLTTSLLCGGSLSMISWAAPLASALLLGLILAGHPAQPPSFYHLHRDALVLLAYCCCTALQLFRATPSVLPAALLPLASQARFCIQAPLQAALMAASVAALLCSRADAWTLLLGVVAGAVPLVLYRLEAQARGSFLSLVCQQHGMASAAASPAQLAGSLAQEASAG